MKLKNKRSGEIKDFVLFDGKNELQGGATLKDLVEEWEDAPEEPKEFWFVDADGEVRETNYLSNNDKSSLRNFGNYFSSREEAEKAVRKLQAWKRLKDKGFRFDHIRSIDGVSIKYKDLDQYTIIAYADEDGCDQECLDLLFGGEE